MAEIKQIFEKEKYMDLILEADPDKEIVEKYIKDAEMYGLFENKKILAEIIITKVDNNICELKNIATKEDARGNGYGLLLYGTINLHIIIKFDNSLHKVYNNV